MRPYVYNVKVLGPDDYRMMILRKRTMIRSSKAHADFIPSTIASSHDGERNSLYMNESNVSTFENTKTEDGNNDSLVGGIRDSSNERENFSQTTRALSRSLPTSPLGSSLKKFNKVQPV